MSYVLVKPYLEKLTLFEHLAVISLRRLINGIPNYEHCVCQDIAVCFLVRWDNRIKNIDPILPLPSPNSSCILANIQSREDTYPELIERQQGHFSRPNRPKRSGNSTVINFVCHNN